MLAANHARVRGRQAPISASCAWPPVEPNPA